jgi:SAM-dependent methyltransferase
MTGVMLLPGFFTLLAAMDGEVKKHWENIYSTKMPEEVSWTEETPSHSLQIIAGLQLPHDAHIADIGGGDSKLTDHLLALGYTNLTVVDISAAALLRAQKRLGTLASKVHWVESNVTEYIPERPIDLWHDRAAFHFLTDPGDVEKYLAILQQFATGYVLLSTFSTNGPAKCSRLPVQQYSEGTMTACLENNFHKIRCQTYLHITPAGAEQEFISCWFKRKSK